MLTLLHFGGAICAQKVRVALAEKQLPWESRIVLNDLRSPEYLKLNPHGYVPTLVHDGSVVTESRIINEYLEDRFPERPLLPKDPFARARIRLWTKQPDDSLHLFVYVLTFAISFRQRVLALTPEARAASMPLDNPVKLEYTKDLLEHGFASPYFATAVRRFRTMLADMETALEQSAWLGGDEYSLADVDLTPYLRRLDDLGLWMLVRDEYPRVAAWYDTVRCRPSFASAILEWVDSDTRARDAQNAAAAAPRLAEALKSHR